MADDNSTMLSQSLMDNADASAMRDPFAKAQQQYQDRMGSGSVLSSSPVSSVQPPNNNPPIQSGQPSQSLLFNPSNQQDFSNFNSSPIPKALQSMGIDNKNLALNELGKVQLVGRLKQKFGASYSDSPQVMQLLDMFDKHLKGLKGNDSMNASIAGGQRTLAALLGG